MKIKGNELQEFMNDAWPGGDDYYWDHDEFDDRPDPAVEYDTEALGNLHWQGRKDDPTDGEGLDLSKLIREWRKSRTHDLLSVYVPKEKLVEFKAFLKTIKATVK